jgi:hypothetical protein
MESEEGANRRYAIALSKGIPQTRSAFKCRLLGKNDNNNNTNNNNAIMIEHI